MNVLRNHTHARGWPLMVLALSCLLSVPCCLLLPEEDLSGERTKNLRPVVRITGGVIKDSADVKNSAVFEWYGADHDGVIRWFEWAVDDTFSENAWQTTTGFSAEIPLQIEALDKSGGYSAWHSFFLRSVDDKYARSIPVRRHFNAHTIAPTTQIIKPVPKIRTPTWASTFQVTWRGEDPDALGDNDRPALFEIKQIRLPSSSLDADRIRRYFETNPNLLLGNLDADDYPNPKVHEKARLAWMQVPGTTNSHWLSNMQHGRTYAFAVRAIDEAGALEQVFQRGTNFLVFTVRDQRIVVYLSEPALGFHTFNGGDFKNPWQVTIAPEQSFRFEWIADATASGTDPGQSNYGFGIPDPDVESCYDPDGVYCWTGWVTRDRLHRSFSFPHSEEGTTHHFYLKMRDVSGKLETETRCWVEIHVAAMSFSRKFLIVDDLREPYPMSGVPYTGVSDAVTDAWRNRVLGSLAEHLLGGMTLEDVDVYNTYGLDDCNGLATIPQSFLSTLGRYQNVIWDAGGVQPGFRSAARDLHLSRYVGLGGNMLIMVTGGAVGTIDSQGFPKPGEGESPFSRSAQKCAHPNAMREDEAWNRLGFLWQHLHIRGCVEKPRKRLHAAEKTWQSAVGATAIDASYPDLALDTERWGKEEFGIRSFECLEPEANRYGTEPWYWREPGLTNIYVVRTHKEKSRLANKPIAWKTEIGEEDLQSGIHRGRIVCFNMSLYYFEEPAVQTALTRALTWMVTGKDY
ncbi:hypothetical protein ACFL6M_04210 [Candidatus Eisenbacteria bacterium]|uniref:Uncharacterized protein n=1 Tax=Eiseniibacteriota bacterium TaxID=2212470 RepID=A0ABV6YKC3_UNCEI